MGKKVGGAQGANGAGGVSPTSSQNNPNQKLTQQLQALLGGSSQTSSGF